MYYHENGYRVGQSISNTKNFIKSFTNAGNFKDLIDCIDSKGIIMW